MRRPGLPIANAQESGLREWLKHRSMSVRVSGRGQRQVIQGGRAKHLERLTQLWAHTCAGPLMLGDRATQEPPEWLTDGAVEECAAVSHRNRPWGLAHPADSGGMAFHHDLWVLAGTAAPVIALVNAVGVTDPMRVASEYGRRGMHAGLPETSRGGFWRALSRGERVNFLSYMVAFFSFVLNLFALAFALVSLALERDVLPRFIEVVIVIVTMLGLLAQGVLGILGRALAEIEWSAADAEASPPDKGSATPA